MTVPALHRLLAALLIGAAVLTLVLPPLAPGQLPPSADPMVAALGLDATRPLSILTLQSSKAPLTPFVGRRFENAIHGVGSIAALSDAVRRTRWDVVALLVDKPQRDPAIVTDLESQGYVVLVDDDRYLVALPRDRLRIEPLADTATLQWTPWATPPGATLDLVDNRPEVTSAAPVDAGFMSQEFAIDRTLLVEAAFDGRVVGSESHAANLSLLGKQSILFLKAGSYLPTQTFRAVLPTSADGNGASRIAFGLGGWAKGSGHLQLARVTISQFTIDPRSVSDAATPTAVHLGFRDAAVFVASVALLLSCAWLGRSVLALLDMRSVSLLGGGLVIGYSALSAASLLSLRWLSDASYGAYAFLVVLAVLASRRALFATRGRTSVVTRADVAPASNASTLDVLIALSIASWVAVIGAIYLPLQLIGSTSNHQMPQIYDLPKHLFTVASLYGAHHWPPPSPFFAGEAFAYNFCFYFPPALMAKLAGTRLAAFQTFPVAVAAIAVALPMVVLDIVRTLTSSKGVHLASILLVTWIGGLTPLWLNDHATLGAFLFNQQVIQSAVWAEEMITYVIYVPQHVFAALCALLTIFLLTGRTDAAAGDIRRLWPASVVAFAGSMSSFLLLPYIVVGYVGGALYVLYRRLIGPDRRPVSPLRRSMEIALATVPLLMLMPFVIEAARWSGAATNLVTWPILSGQWFYVLSGFGVAALFALFCIPAAIRGFHDSDVRRLAAGIGGLALLGIGGLLTGGAHADAGIKAALVLRVAIVPLAAIGLIYLLARGRTAGRASLVSEAAAAMMGAVLTVNLPTVTGFLRSSWMPFDSENRYFVDQVRRLPEGSRIVMFSAEQSMVARLARPVDFDFSPFRPDSYLPPDARPRVQEFWNGFANGAPEAVAAVFKRYDFAIAPLDSDAYERLNALFTDRTIIGGYAVYAVHATAGR